MFPGREKDEYSGRNINTQYYLLFATVIAPHLTSALTDISSFAVTVVVVPVAVVNEDRKAVFTVIVVRVTCEE